MVDKGLIRLRAYLIKHKIIIIYSILIAIGCYGYELFNFSLSLDEEGFSFSKAINRTDWIADGRWGTYFINCVFMPFSIIPYLPTLIAVLGIAFSASIFINSEEHDLLSKLVFCTIFITFPIHSYYLTFNTFTIAIGIGLVLSVLAFVITKKAIAATPYRYIQFIIPILLLTISFSTYQAIMIVYVILSIAHILSIFIKGEVVDLKKIVRTVLILISVFILAFLLYKLIDLLVKFLYSDNSIVKNRKYLDGYNGWGKSENYVVVNNLINSIYRYIRGQRFYGGGIMNSVFLIVPSLIVVFSIKVKGLFQKILAVFFLLFLVLSPFAVMMMVGRDLPPRAMLSLAFMLASLWWLLFINFKNWIKDVFVLATVFFLFSNIYCTTRLFYSTYVNWQADRDMTNRITERIYALNVSSNEHISVVFIGAYKHQDNQLFLSTNWDILGCSFFQYNKGDAYRIFSFMKTLGINDFKFVDDTPTNIISQKYKDKPSWPQRGSVFICGDTVVVKLSN